MQIVGHNPHMVKAVSCEHSWIGGLYMYLPDLDCQVEIILITLSMYVRGCH